MTGHSHNTWEVSLTHCPQCGQVPLPKEISFKALSSHIPPVAMCAKMRCSFTPKELTEDLRISWSISMTLPKNVRLLFILRVRSLMAMSKTIFLRCCQGTFHMSTGVSPGDLTIKFWSIEHPHSIRSCMIMPTGPAQEVGPIRSASSSSWPGSPTAAGGSSSEECSSSSPSSTRSLSQKLKGEVLLDFLNTSSLLSNRYLLRIFLTYFILSGFLAIVRLMAAILKYNI